MQDAYAKTVTTGWLVGVMLEVEGEPKPLRHYYAVGHADQGRAEWTAVDRAIMSGKVATSPIGGIEPVQALKALSAWRMKVLGLALGEVRELGPNHPRRWLA
ncbi:hypothetical protein ACO2Q0_14910 [Phenylobacterium sp. VNQ135]|uniref:hypothetical protein n=1 Tax=Phenylobacterium sp. VNQ135 TaxID=3400922 RepID=UPI003C09524B